MSSPDLRDLICDPPADVVIIGAGASGGVAGKRLLEAGLKVVALEQGEWQDRSAYRGSEWDWELTAGGRWSCYPDQRRSPADYPLDLRDSDMAVMNFNGVGGGTILFNAIWTRLLPSDFRTATEFGTGVDWPLGYDELRPFYDRVDADIGVSGLGGNPAYPDAAEPPLPPLPFGRGAMRVARAFHRRGWHWWPDTNAILSAPYRGRHQCVQRGACAQGCNEGAKSSVDLTHWKAFETLGGELRTRARVRRIVTDDRGMAAGVEWVDGDGLIHFQAADMVLMAANAIGTPRLLLASASERFPNGLCNGSGRVGRGLMMHPLAVVFGYFDEQLEGWQGQFGSTVATLEFARDEISRGFRGGTKWALHPTGGGPVQEAIRTLSAGASADQFHARFASRFGHGLFWSIMCEDFAEDDNRVLLSPNVRDDAGIAAPRLIYRTSANSAAALSFAVERAGDIMRDAGAWAVEAHNPAGSNAHPLGTARMGMDPATSVVDPWGISHDIPNLGIIDGSVFVTSSAVNPTSTICALALRAAERIIERWPQRTRPGAVSFADNHRVAPEPAPAAAEEAPGALAGQERQRIAALADQLLAPVDDIASGGTILLAGGGLDRVLGVRPDLLVAARRAAALPGGADAVLTQLREGDQGLWHDVLTLIFGAYYTDAGVMRRIGYAGQVPRPQTPDRYPPYIEEGLLDHMLTGEWAQTWYGQQAMQPQS